MAAPIFKGSTHPLEPHSENYITNLIHTMWDFYDSMSRQRTYINDIDGADNKQLRLRRRFWL